MTHEKAERLTRMQAVVALLIAALLASCRIDEAGSDNDRIPAQYREAVLEVMTRYHIPGAVAGVWNPGRAPWKIAQGVADVQTRRPISLSDYFPTRSVTKSFTVTVLLQLVRDGAVSLDDTIDRYVPGIPNGDRITLMQLAAMESGVKDYSQVDGFLEKFIPNPGTAWTPLQLIAYAVSGSPIFDPGARYDYSNSNTVLLGLVIEKVTQAPLVEAYRARIFEPLQLAHTSYPSESELPDPHPTPYSLDTITGAVDEQPLINPTALGASGGMVSTLDDLAAWGDALGSGRLLTPELQMLRMTHSRAATNGPEYDLYGLGIGSLHGWWGHTGSGVGFQAATFRDLKTGTTIAVLVNATPTASTGPELNLAQEIFAALANVVDRQ
jgi:D-alanyl-D-alanine carboxypeptidase